MNSFSLILTLTGEKRSEEESRPEWPGGWPASLPPRAPEPCALYPTPTLTNQEGNLIEDAQTLRGPSEYSASSPLQLGAGWGLRSGLGANKPHPSKKLSPSPKGESKMLWQLAIQGAAFLSFFFFFNL